jgi:nucleotidyltransferase substrate binding protein (TIGR01987 family)
MKNSDIRYLQRFSNYKKAFLMLEEGIDLFKNKELSRIEKQGLIQAFEFTHELSWKVLKDFIENRGNEKIYGSKDAVKIGFNLELIKNGQVWMDMIKSRNLTSHTYDENIANQVVSDIVNIYYDEFKLFLSSFEKIIEK